MVKPGNHNPEGDVLMFNGEVTRKFVDAQGRHCVELAQRAANQDNEDSILGTGVVALPLR